MLRRLGDRHGQADAWDTLGYAHDQLSQHHRAVRSFQHALRLYREIGARLSRAA